MANMRDEQITQMINELESLSEQWSNQEKNFIVTNRELSVLTTALLWLQDSHKNQNFEDMEVTITKQLLERISKLQGEKQWNQIYNN